MQRQQRGVVLDRAELGRIEHGLRHEQRHVGHDAQIRVAGLHQLERLGRLPALRLMHGEALLAREHLEGILGTARLVGRAEHGDDILLALEQLLEHGLAEGLLSMHDDTHFPRLLARLAWMPACAGMTSPPRRRGPTPGHWIRSCCSLGISCPPIPEIDTSPLSVHRSRHSGFNCSIRRTFQALFHFFICFSRRIAAGIVWWLS